MAPATLSLAPPSLAARATRGLIWLLGQTVLSRGLQAAAQVALAWLLSPADFGQVGLAYTVTTIVAGLFGFGFEEVLLQRHRAMRLWLGTVFRLGLAAGLLTAASLLLAAPLGAALYGQPRLVGLIAVVALATPLTALATVPLAVLRARLDFPRLAMVSLGEVAATAALSIGFAGMGCGAYSFVLPLPLVAAGRTLLLWRMARPSVRGGSRRWRLLLPSASAALGTQLLTTLVGQGDYLVLGLVAAEAQVGLYYFGYKLAVQPLRMLAGSLSAVLFPALVQYRDDPIRQRDAALQVSQLLALVVMPACVLQAALTPSLLSLFFQPQWQEAAPLIQLLSLGLAVDAASWVAGALLHARGEFRQGLVYSLAAAPVFFAAVTAGALLAGPIGVAGGGAGFYLLVGPVYCRLVFSRAGPVGWRRIAAIYLTPALLSAGAVAGALAVAQAISPAAWVQLLVVPPLALAAYLALLRLLCPEPYDRLKQRVTALRSRPLPV